ncbi:MAG: hypothetical protein ACTSYH_00365 [Candidatus Heimdallarchaeaceae archaeon]
MDSFNKRKLLPILSCFLFIITFMSTSVNAVEQKTSIFYSDPGDLYSTRFSSANVVDNDGQLHVFIKKEFENNTFVIFHIFNNQMEEIFRNVFAESFFQAYSMDVSVVLIFTYSGSYYGTIVMMFSWSETGSNFKQLYSSPSVYFEIDIVAGDGCFYLFSNEIGTIGTSIMQITAYLNGTILETYFTISLPSIHLASLHILNNELFAFYDIYQYNDTSYTSSRTLIIAGITGNFSYYNSSVFIIESDFDKTQLFVGEDGKFHLTLLEFQIFYSVSFSVNDTITLGSFNTINLGIYIFEKYEMISYQNTSFFVFATASYFETFDLLNYNPYFQPIKVSVVEDDNQTISLFSFLIEDVYYYYSYRDDGSIDRVSLTIFENRTYIASYPSLIESNTISDYKFEQRYVMAINIQTNSNVELPAEPFLFDIISYSNFVYFWIKYWYTVAIPVIILGLIYLIFMKRINRGFGKLKKFLTRPIKPGVSTFKLVFINIWLYLTNIFSIIFSLWKADKKRLFISLLGLAILASIIVTSTSLYDSKASNLIVEYARDADFGNNNAASVNFNLDLMSFSGLDEDRINPNITEQTLDEIMYVMKSKTQILPRLITNSYYGMQTEVVGFQLSPFEDITYMTYRGYMANYSAVLGSFLESGRLPTSENEALLPVNIGVAYGIDLDDVITINATGSSGYLDISTIDMAIVGFIQQPSYSQLENACDLLDLPSDPIRSFAYDNSLIIPMEYFLSNFENVTKYHLQIYGEMQFVYDFENSNSQEITDLITEVTLLREEGPFPLSSASLGIWEIGYELIIEFTGINLILSVSQILILFLSIPILYLAWFLVFEINELFGTSFEQEIKILRSKGVSTGTITFSYSMMKLFESLVATFLGFGLTMILLPILLTVDTFLTFNDQIYGLSLASLPISMSITFVLLIVISIPRIIILARKDTKKVKPPRKWVQLLKQLRIHYIFLIILGFVIFGIGYFLTTFLGIMLIAIGFQLIGLIFIYTMGIGFMIILLGVGLLLKDLHKLLMIVISKLSWSARKSIISFSLVEVRADIKLFNNTFLTYSILIGLLLPFIITPISIQNKVTNQAYFYGGGDLFINEWISADISLEDFQAEHEKIANIAYITQISVSHGNANFGILIVEDPIDYLATSYKPTSSLYENWEADIESLQQNNTMLVSSPFLLFYAGQTGSYAFKHHNSSDIDFAISGVFDYFPIIYDVGDLEDVYSYTYDVVMSLDNFLEILDRLYIIGVSLDRLLIKVKPLTDHAELATEIEDVHGLNVYSSEEIADAALLQYFPFYPMIVAEFVFGVIICLAAVVFTSLSNPLKILQRRIVKHDALKKMGISTRQIILVSAIELFIASIVPGLLLGALAGYGLERGFNAILLGLSYDMLPYTLPFPYILVLCLFLGIPLLFFGIYYLSMKRNFAKYQPRNLE